MGYVLPIWLSYYIRIDDRSIEFRNGLIGLFSKYYRYDDIEKVQYTVTREGRNLKIYTKEGESRKFYPMMTKSRDCAEVLRELNAHGVLIERRFNCR